MAGHSKWANIKHRKARQDASRGKLWTKLIREITVAARQGGGEINDNPRLRTAVDKAMGANMPKDTIDRAIARGVGGGDGDQVEELTYEGYGPGGVAIFVEAMTDNRNRTVAEVRHAFTKHGGNLGTDGSVSYLFEKQGIISFAPGADEDAILEAALEAGAEDVRSNDDNSMTVVTTPEAFNDVREALAARSLEPDDAEVGWIPEVYTPVDAETSATVIKLIEVLEDLDDVQAVHSNGDFDYSLLK